MGKSSNAKINNFGTANVSDYCRDPYRAVACVRVCVCVCVCVHERACVCVSCRCVCTDHREEREEFSSEALDAANVDVALDLLDLYDLYQ